MNDKQKVKKIIESIEGNGSITQNKLSKILSTYPKDNGRIFKKNEIFAIYKLLVKNGEIKPSKEFEDIFQTKPIRTQSGVVPVSIMTKPFPCPGRCIFCPDDVRMPKSYLRDEPGAMRAEANKFDPYMQTINRIKAFEMNGHSTDKIEIIILGGTWSAYEHKYQEWFIQRTFDALNGVNSKSLEEAQIRNENAKHRCIGLVIETRPDHITIHEIKRLRRYGVTKVQIGVQSIRDRILELNKRGETTQEHKKAIRLLRLAGFKIHVHWMPNLYGATLETDKEDYQQLWQDRSYRPDELKIYPCSILRDTELYNYYKNGEYRPYSEQELIDLLATVKPLTPRYARLTRIIRDIPSGNIISGNKKTNLRQLVWDQMRKNGDVCNCIRCREVRNEEFNIEDIKYEELRYDTSATQEIFASYKLKTTDKILGFMRLSIPSQKYRRAHFMDELKESAIIREVHVYGSSLRIGEEGRVQHLGLGTKLIKQAETIARQEEIKKLSVISAIGTRNYYKKLGFSRCGSYMCKAI